MLRRSIWKTVMRALYPLIPLALAVGLAGAARAEVFTVGLDHASRLNVRGSAANVVVGNPAVADVSVVDSHTLFVLGRAYGATGLNVTDDAGRTLFAGEVQVVRPAGTVSLYRGVTRADFACGSSACAPATPAAGLDGK